MFLESCCFGVSAGFRHDPRMLFVKDPSHGVVRAVTARVCEFMAHHETFRLLECTSVVLMVGYSSVSRTITLDWYAIGCVGWFSYS